MIASKSERSFFDARVADAATAAAAANNTMPKSSGKSGGRIRKWRSRMAFWTLGR